MRNKFGIYIFISLITSMQVLGRVSPKNDHFKFYYKNLNTLGAIICSLEASKRPVASGFVRLFKIDSDKGSIGAAERIEFSGTCNGEMNLKTKEVVSFGQSFSLDFTTSSLKSIKGKLGLKEIMISFQKSIPTFIQITDPFTKIKKGFDLSEINWAKKNSIISFKKDDLISIKKKGKILAVENASNIKLSGVDFYNIWNYSSFGCQSYKDQLNQSQCQELTDLL